jgi:Holliday junction resolvasome RuvABC endonuclease subunit
MITLNKKDLEKKLNLKLKDDVVSIGLDCATRSGICKLTIADEQVTLDYSFLDLRKVKDNFERYDYLIQYFNDYFYKLSTIDKNTVVVIEDIFFGKSVATLKLLARIGAIAYVIAKLYKLKVILLLASQARNAIGLKNAKKQVVQKEFLKRIDLKLKDEDAVDAIILSLVGATNKEDLNI